jgi:hypothetical protein
MKKREIKVVGGDRASLKGYRGWFGYFHLGFWRVIELPSVVFLGDSFLGDSPTIFRWVRPLLVAFWGLLGHSKRLGRAWSNHFII